MKKNYCFNLVILIGLLAFLCIMPQRLLADTLDLSFSLTEGGVNLELTEAFAYKGVKIDITSDVSARYQVVQNLLMPLESMDNPGAVIRDNFVLRVLRGTNAFGTIHIPSGDIPVRSGETLYTSNETGASDTFTLVYGLADIGNIPAGHYRGQIGFILNPIDSTRERVTKYLYVYVTISQKEIGPGIEISTTTGSKIISLNPLKEEKQTADVIVKVKGSFKNMFRINHFLVKPIESNEGNVLDYEAVNVAAGEVRKGKGISYSALSIGQQTIYNSAPSGDADEAFIITYGLSDIAGKKAGRYKSRLEYTLEEMGKQTKLETLELEVENDPVFDLFITTPDQRSSIEFSDLKPNESRQSELIVEIKSNLGRPYQVTQNILSELTDTEGNTIAQEYFTLKTESLDTKGRLKFLQKQAVEKGDTSLFISDNDGSSDKFKVIYELTSPRDLRAGSYSTRVIYSLLRI